MRSSWAKKYLSCPILAHIGAWRRALVFPTLLLMLAYLPRLLGSTSSSPDISELCCATVFYHFLLCKQLFLAFFAPRAHPQLFVSVGAPFEDLVRLSFPE